MKEKRKILFIIWSFSYGGGAEKILSNLLCSISDEVEIDLLEVEHFDTSWEKLPGNVRVLTPVNDNTDKTLRGRVSRFFKHALCRLSGSAFRRIARKTTGYDCVVAFNYLIPAMMVYPMECSICWNHGCIDDLRTKAYWRNQEWKALEFANAIVAISERTKNSIYSIYPTLDKEVKLVYNGYDIEEMRLKAKDAASTELSENSVLWIGRLDENKDPLRALRIFKDASDACDEEMHLYYIGEGELHEKIENEARHLNVTDHVHLLGFQPNPYPYIKQASCLLSTSKLEGFPTVLVESIALGTPFVCSNVAGSMKISNSGEFGFVYDSDDDASRALVQLVQNGLDSEQIEAMKAHAESFSLNRYKTAFMSLLDEVCPQ